jgi:hypothetical protein
MMAVNLTMTQNKEYFNMLPIRDILRAQDVKRWTIVRTSVQQSLAEHTFNVVMIARSIAVQMDLSDQEVNDVVYCALGHDLDEILDGDIPSPVKEKNPGMFPRKKGDWPDRVIQIVKAADLIEAHWFIKDAGQGRHADQVKGNALARMKRYFAHCDKEVSKAAYNINLTISTGEFKI